MVKSPRKSRANQDKFSKAHMAKIGAKGGKKAPGTFKTKRGLAKAAGIMSGKRRRLNAINREIHEIEEAIAADMPEDDAVIATQKKLELFGQAQVLEMELEGRQPINLGNGFVTEFEDQDEPFKVKGQEVGDGKK